MTHCYSKFCAFFAHSSDSILWLLCREQYLGVWLNGISLRVFILISHVYAVLICEISKWTQEEKFHISKQPCIILLTLSTSYWQEEAGLIHGSKREYIAIHSWCYREGLMATDWLSGVCWYRFSVVEIPKVHPNLHNKLIFL